MDWFATQLLAWFETHGRKNLPWQQDITPYRVWVSEIMLQQTQVTTVIDYYQRFMAAFPDVATLAHAPLDEVLHLWTGLGYYARARNLHKAAQYIWKAYNGEFPESQETLEALPGIGRSTAGAIRAIAMNQSAAILDGNVRRVLARFHTVEGYPGQSAVSKTLWQYAEEHTPQTRTAAYTQAIMDLGATICTRTPSCNACPLASRCAAYAKGETTRYPGKKPKREKPVRQSRFFVIVLPGNLTYFEQQPPDGLWGGLWTPPQREAHITLDCIMASLGFDSQDIERTHIAPSFRHTFTHFHLDIEPVYAFLRASNRAQVETPAKTGRWVNANDVNAGREAIGLCKPAVTLMASLQDTFN